MMNKIILGILLITGLVFSSCRLYTEKQYDTAIQRAEASGIYEGYQKGFDEATDIYGKQSEQYRNVISHLLEDDCNVETPIVNNELLMEIYIEDRKGEEVVTFHTKDTIGLYFGDMKCYVRIINIYETLFDDSSYEVNGNLNLHFPQ